jgi:epoxyqueuosine reductase QueG
MIMDRTRELKDIATGAGADCVGVADLEPFRGTLPSLSQHLIDDHSFALSLAVRLDDAVLSAITDHPTLEYAEHYRAVNGRLDAIAARIVSFIAGQGYHGVAVPASQILDETGLVGAISHKAVARVAGVGWQGKSLLIVHPRFGPRIRLATVLTNMPLVPDRPIRQRCGACAECSKACPAQAIRNVSAEEGYDSREQALYFDRCAAQTLKFKGLQGIGARICGVCVKACPFGGKRKKQA